MSEFCLSVQGIQIVQAIKIVETFLTDQLCQKFCFFSQQFFDFGEVWLMWVLLEGKVIISTDILYLTPKGTLVP